MINRSHCVMTAAAMLLAASAQTVRAAQLGDVFYIELENHNFTQPNGNVVNATGNGGTVQGNTGTVANPVLSNQTIQQLYGNTAAPYLNSLITPGNASAAQVSYASAYHNVLATPSGANPSIHPSEPNYIWQEGGSNYGTAGDADPFTGTGASYPQGNSFNQPSLSGLLQASGQSWRAYAEGAQLAVTAGSTNNPGANALTNTVLPQSQWTVPIHSFSGTSASYTNPYNLSHQYNLAPKHVGQLFFNATNGGSTAAADTAGTAIAADYAPLEQFQSDLTNNTVAKYSVITPDQYNDMHSGLTGGFTYNGTHYTGDAALIAQGDNFLSKIVPLIEASSAYKNNGAIVIWNDEVEAQDKVDAATNDFSHTSTEIVISPLAKGNAYTNSIAYTHSSDVMTLQEVFQIPTAATPSGFLGDAATPGTNDLSDLFQAGTIPSSVPEPTTLGLVGVTAMALLGRRRRTV